MKITSVSVKKIVPKEGSKMRAKVSVVLDDCFIIKYMRVIETEKGLIVAMPSKKFSLGVEGKAVHVDIVNPLNQETRNMFNEAVWKAYHEAPEATEDDEEEA